MSGPSSPRGTSNSNVRGSAASRRARKAWLLAQFGDGYSAPCAFCGFEVDWYTITTDRFPLAGIDGGKYVQGNIRPSCLPCNSIDGNTKQRSRSLTESQGHGKLVP